MKIILLGDSVFDNENYVQSETEAVLGVLQNSGYKCELLARDGAIIRDVVSQIEKLEDNPKHNLFLSVGGNDALGTLDLVYRNIHLNLDEMKFLLKEFYQKFERDIHHLYAILSKKYKNKEIYVCTIYYPNFDFNDRSIVFNQIKQMGYQSKIFELVDTLNEILIRKSEEYKFGTLDINQAFHSKIYYANEIEPSFEGSKLLAGMIRDVLKSNISINF
jgi:hypothetical protein